MKPVFKAYEASSAQKRLYMINHLLGDSILYNEIRVWTIKGNLDAERLKDAAQKLGARHESLRTCFAMKDGEVIQKVYDEIEINFKYTPSSSFSISPAFQTLETPSREDIETITGEFLKPFNLGMAPVWKIELVQLSLQSQVLLFDFHHIIADGASMEIIIGDLMALYQGYELPEPEVQYVDFTLWQNDLFKSDEIRKQEEYWLNVFKGELPVLELPTDFSRSSESQITGSSIGFEIDSELTVSLNRLAVQNKTTLFAVLLAVFNVVLSKYSNQKDIVVGIPVSGRSQAEFENVVGMFVGTVAMRNYPDLQKTFVEFLQEVSGNSFDAFENQDYQFEMLVEKVSPQRQLNRNPIFDVMFAWQNYPAAIRVSGGDSEDDGGKRELEFTPFVFKSRSSKFDWLLQAFEVENRVVLRMEYRSSLFSEAMMDRWKGHFTTLCKEAVSNPGKTILDMAMLTEDEMETLLFTLNDTKVDDYPLDKPVHELFEMQAERTPGNMGVKSIHGELTYKELNAASNRLAHLLQEKGVKRDSIVGLMMERSIEMIVAIWAILKAGGAYLPIDTDYPEKRVFSILEDNDVEVLLTCKTMTDAIPIEKLETIPPAENSETSVSPVTSVAKLHSIPQKRCVVVVDAIGEMLQKYSGSNPTHINTPWDLIYLISTSGSTGKPKSVMLEHRNMVNLLYFTFTRTCVVFDRVLQFASIGFDASAQEIFSAHLTGGEIFMITRETRYNLPDLFSYIQQNDVRVLFMPPAFLRTVFEEEEYARMFPTTVRHICPAGEQLIINARFRRYLKENNVHCHNFYGPSETHVVTTLTMAPNETIPDRPYIGKPISNTRCLILDQGMKPTPIGVIGDLYIEGTQVGRGYLNRPTLTAAKFLTHELHELHELKELKDFKNHNKSFCGGPGGDFHEKSPLGTLYKTGDLARWMQDGNVEFLGRADFQVKIRGFRVELEEIENRLKEMEEVKDAVVLDNNTETGDKYLTAYLVCDNADRLDVEGIRARLTESLPDFMVPSYFIPVPGIPLNISGKVDRKALRSLTGTAGKETRQKEYIPPANELEDKLAEVWADVLKQEKSRVGMTDNFFDLGGHSLRGTVLLSKVFKNHGVRVPLAELFRRPTVRGMAEYMMMHGKLEEAAIPKAPQMEYYPQSAAQRRLFFLHQFENIKSSYNLPYSFFIKEEVDGLKMEEVFRRLIQRHESLRTSFHLIDNRPVQKIHESVDFAVKYTDRADIVGDVDIEEIILGFMRPFDLSQAPLFRVGIVKLKKDRPLYLFVVVMHHIITDGVSLDVFASDFVAFYQGRDPEGLKIQYRDYAVWQESETVKAVLRNEEKYWLKVFGDEIPVLNLPTDYPRPAVQHYEGSSISFPLEENLSGGLKQMAQVHGATLYMVLLAVFNVLIHKWSGQEDIVVGTPIAGRRHADLENIVGMFVNTLALRNYPGPDISFETFLQNVKNHLTDAYENQEYPFEELVDRLSIPRDVSRNPLFDVVFALHNQVNRGLFSKQNRTPTGNDLENFETYEYNAPFANFDLELHSYDDSQSLRFLVNFSTSLYKKETIQRWMGYLIKIIESAVHHPKQAVGDIEILSEEEKRYLLFDLNDTEASYPDMKTLHRLFDERAEQHPQNAAVSLPNGCDCLTYAEVKEKSDRVAFYLREQGVMEGTIVAIMGERSVETIIGILGILKAGGAYLPIDPDYPQDRIDYMLKDSRANTVLFNKESEPFCKPSRMDGFLTDKSQLSINNYQLTISNEREKGDSQIKSQLSINNYQLTINNEREKGDSQETPLRGGAFAVPGYSNDVQKSIDSDNIDNSFKNNNSNKSFSGGLGGGFSRKEPPSSNSLAYVIYTSGTTGKPKGALIEHRNVVRLLFNDRFQFHFTSHDVWTLFHSLCFDFSVWEMYGALLYGGKLVIVPRMTAVDTPIFLQLLHQERVTVLNQTPSSFYRLIDEELKKDEPTVLSLRYIIFGGEALNPARLKEFNKRFPAAQLINMFGITETTVHVTYKEITGKEINEGISNIGKPIPTLTCYVVDKRMNMVPIGVPGELLVGGDGVGRGYLNRPELTRGSFVKPPLDPAKLLLTPLRGDLLWRQAPSGGFLNGQPLHVEEKGDSQENDDSRMMNDDFDNNINKSFGKVQETLSRKGFLVSPQSLYKSGDLVRWLDSGEMEYLGRIDTQVKVRGFRIELGEIENSLLDYEGIKDAVAVFGKNKESGDDYYLCAYIVPVGEKVDLGGLRSYLSGKLPDYMVPSYFVQLEVIPLTPNGKIDRRALPGPSVSASESFVQARSETELRLVETWREVLGIDETVRVGIDDNFFELGGHSLKATVMIAKVHEVLNIKIPLVQVFETPTIRGLSEFIDQSRVDLFSSIQPAPKSEYYPLSSAQKRLYVLQQIELKGIGYNLPQEVALDLELDIDKIARTFKNMIRRHEILRTSFHMVENQPAQKVHNEVKFEVEIVEEKETFTRPFDLSCAPLLRVGIVKKEGQNLLLVDMHHIITDAASQEIMMKEFTALYEGKELPSLSLQYKDFSVWQNSSRVQTAIREQESFWLSQFETEIPVLQLPWDFKRPEVQSFEGKAVSFSLDEETSAKLRAFALKEEATLFIVLLSAFYVLLSKLSGQEDIVIGTPAAGRRHADLLPIMGMFVNTLALRNYPGGKFTFKEFLKTVKNHTLQCFENQEYQFEDLVDKVGVARDLSRNPLFDVMFAYHNQRDPMKGSGGDENYESETSKFDLVLHGIEGQERHYFYFEYCIHLFKETTIRRFAKYFLKTLRFLLENPGQALMQVDITEEEEKGLLEDMSNGIREEDGDLSKTIHELFEEQAERTPDSIAAVDPSGTGFLSYGCLNEKANGLAHAFRERGVKPDSPVSLMVDRSFEMIAGILGVLKAGGAVVPIDPLYPEDRIITMLNDSGSQILATTPKVSDAFSYSALLDLKEGGVEPMVTGVRPQIKNFDELPVIDRTLINYEKYMRFIGEAAASNAVSLQATRGCPFNCVYCHKIWPKSHIVRSAEKIFEEIKMCYDAGIRKFSFIDDVFNLNRQNAANLMNLIIKNKLDTRLYFPNGFRGDVLTKELIDLLVEAGTVNIDMALETASPRLQKLIGKNLNLDIFQENLDYITSKYPHVILEMETMHGFPTETQEEALMTLDFIMKQKWVHFPYVNILRIFRNTEMYKLAIRSGITDEAVERSAHTAFHELPETLPFPGSFTRAYQARFMNEYFLSKERLMAVLPAQMKIMTETELIQKYDSYLPMKINSFDDLLKAAGIAEDFKKEYGQIRLQAEDNETGRDFVSNISHCFPKREKSPQALRILLLDLSLEYSANVRSKVYDVNEQPLGLMSLMTYLDSRFGENIVGHIAKSRIDFDSDSELMKLIEGFKPGIVGIRSLSYFKDFVHRSVSLIRGFLPDVPIIAGGPYATSDFRFMLQDPNIDLAVLGEGEWTLAELIEKMLENKKQLPEESVLQGVNGIAFVKNSDKERLKQNRRDIFNIEKMGVEAREVEPSREIKPGEYSTKNPGCVNTVGDLLYVIYTSGSTGKPRGVMLQHQNLVNLIKYQYKYTNIDFSRVLQFTTISFDVSFQEILSTLLIGGKLFLIDKETQQDAAALFRVIERNLIHTLFLPGSFLKFVFNEQDYVDHFPRVVRHIVTAGEQLVVSDQLKEYLKTNGVYLHNHYGPSESHVVTALTLSPGENIPDLPSIGVPVMNTSIYLLAAAGYLQPVGVPGELFIGGIQVGRGYLNRPILTAAKFLTHELHELHELNELKDFKNYNKSFYGVQGRFFQKEPLGTLYKTGDLARWLVDGNIEFLGRVDFQVKIRGFRVELGEIESALMKLDMIKEAVVMDRVDEVGQRYLCAYCVPKAGYENDFNDSEIRRRVSKGLPGYMVPSFVVKMESIPLTPNRKVNRRALPVPQRVPGAGGLPVQLDAVQEKMIRIWAEVLQVPQVSLRLDDNFFELGGHSLRAIVLTSRVHKEFGVKLSIRDIFKRSTIRELSSSVSNANIDRFKAIEVSEEKEYYPLSSAQERLYIQQQMKPGDKGYNNPTTLLLEGRLDREKLETIFKQLIQRHESLRTSFIVVDDQPVQRVHPAVEVSMEYYEAQGGDIPGMIDRFIRPFDLSCAPLVRLGLIRVGEGDDRHILMLDMHHIITDGVSMGIFSNEVMALYAGRDLPPVRVQYRDFSIWQGRLVEFGEMEKMEAYWLKQFQGEIPQLDLTYDFPRPSVPSGKGGDVFFEIDEETAAQVFKLVKESGTTLYVFLLSICYVLFSKYTGRDDIVLGTSTAGRSHADLENIIGMFVNMLALRNRPKKEKTFRDFLEEVNENLMDAFANQDYQFEDLVRKLNLQVKPGRNPLFDFIFKLQNMDIPEIKMEGLVLKPYGEYEDLRARFDLVISANEIGKVIGVNFNYSADLFEESTIREMGNHFMEVLQQVLRNPRVSMKEVEISTVFSAARSTLKEQETVFDF